MSTENKGRIVVKVKPSLMPEGDPNAYLLDGHAMTWTTQKKARRFGSRKEALTYVVDHGWDRKNLGLMFMRLGPRPSQVLP